MKSVNTFPRDLAYKHRRVVCVQTVSRPPKRASPNQHLKQPPAWTIFISIAKPAALFQTVTL